MGQLAHILSALDLVRVRIKYTWHQLAHIQKRVKGRYKTWSIYYHHP